jgi:hypothetical protein
MSARFRPQLKVREVFGAARVRLIPALTLACILTGSQCTEEPWDPQPVEASRSAIRFDHADFDPDLAEYALQRYRRVGSQMHLARFSGTDAFAVLTVYKTGACCVIPEPVTESDVGRLLNGAEPDWGDSDHTSSSLGYLRYRMFRLVDQPFNCVGFSQSFGESYDDRGRKRNLVAGYFCYDETRPRSHATAEDLIRQVSVR